MFGKVIDHKIFSKEDLFDDQLRQRSTLDWETYTLDEPYQPLLDQIQVYEQKSSYDLTSAALRHRNFIEKIVKIKYF